MFLFYSEFYVKAGETDTKFIHFYNFPKITHALSDQKIGDPCFIVEENKNTSGTCLSTSNCTIINCPNNMLESVHRDPTIPQRISELST